MGKKKKQNGRLKSSYTDNYMKSQKTILHWKREIVKFQWGKIKTQLKSMQLERKMCSINVKQLPVWRGKNKFLTHIVPHQIVIMTRHKCESQNHISFRRKQSIFTTLRWARILQIKYIKKENKDQMGLIKKCSFKRHHQGNKHTTTEREKIFTTILSNKRLGSRMFKSSHNSIIKRQIPQLKQWGKDLNRHFTRG